MPLGCQLASTLVLLIFDEMTEPRILQIQWNNSTMASRLNPENNPSAPPMLPNLSTNVCERDLFKGQKIPEIIFFGFNASKTTTKNFHWFLSFESKMSQIMMIRDFLAY